jgi:hypothetical protein
MMESVSNLLFVIETRPPSFGSRTILIGYIPFNAYYSQHPSLVDVFSINMFGIILLYILVDDEFYFFKMKNHKMGAEIEFYGKKNSQNTFDFFSRFGRVWKTLQKVLVQPSKKKFCKKVVKSAEFDVNFKSVEKIFKNAPNKVLSKPICLTTI